MKNMVKNEIVLLDPYSNALWGGSWYLSVNVVTLMKYLKGHKSPNVCSYGPNNGLCSKMKSPFELSCTEDQIRNTNFMKTKY